MFSRALALSVLLSLTAAPALAQTPAPSPSVEHYERQTVMVSLKPAEWRALSLEGKKAYIRGLMGGLAEYYELMYLTGQIQFNQPKDIRNFYLYLRDHQDQLIREVDQDYAKHPKMLIGPNALIRMRFIAQDPAVTQEIKDTTPRRVEELKRLEQEFIEQRRHAPAPASPSPKAP